MPPILQTANLSFGFSPKQLLFQDLNLEIPENSIFGLLGPNGAGKSTLLKILLGLIQPQRGTINIFGAPLRRESFRQIGLLIEEPQLYPHLSGLENLRVMSTYRGIPSKRIAEVLEIVDLQAAARQKVRHYSTGMKQRLGMAIALLPDPDLLIFDEPTNGLDPQGIADTRRLIQRLHHDTGKNIIISSHLLSEIEQMCTHLGIIRQGKLLFQGAIKELEQFKLEKLQVEIEVDDAVKAVAILQQQNIPVETISDTRISCKLEAKTQIPAIIDALRGADIAVFQIKLQEQRLEDFFLQLVNQQAS